MPSHDAQSVDHLRPREPFCPSRIVSAKSRKTKDVAFSILFILYWLGMVVISGVAIKNGNLHRLVYATNSEENYCGVLNYNANGTVVDLRDKPNILYLINPSGLLSEVQSDDSERRRIYRKCVSSCPTGGEIICRDNVVLSSNTEEAAEQLATGQCFQAYATVPVMNRCIPQNLEKGMFKGGGASVRMVKYVAKIRNSFYDDLNSDDFVSTVADDLYYSWKLILMACGIAIVLAFFWLLLIQYFAWHVVWLTILCSLLFASAFVVYIWCLYAHVDLPFEIRNETLRSVSIYAQGNTKCLYGLSLFASVALALYFSALVILRRRISLAITIIKCSARATSSFPSLFLIPFLKNFLVLSLSAYILFMFILLATCGDEVSNNIHELSTNITGRSFHPNWIFRYLIIYLIFGFLWTYHAIEAAGQFLLASSIASWYWTPPTARPLLSGWKTIKRSFSFVFFYHFGSIAFGSLVLAFVSIIRFLLDRISKELKRAEKSDNVPRFVIFISASFHCLFGLLEYVVKYINTKVYIEIALYGDSFVESIKRVSLLLASNPVRATVLEGLTSVLLMGVKISITSMCVLFGASSVRNWHEMGGGVSLFYGSTLSLILMFTYTIASSFVSVVETSVDTIFVCFLEECQAIENDRPPSGKTGSVLCRALCMPRELVLYSGFANKLETA